MTKHSSRPLERPFERPFERRLVGAWRAWVSVARPWSALITLRLVFFGLLTYDLWWIALSHAPRYGAGGFNVPHLPWLSAFTPSPDAIGVLYLGGGLLSALAALGVGGRLTVASLALFYNLAYLWSQADSYQHHYLIGLLLCLFAWAPLSPSASTAQRPLDQSPDQPMDPPALSPARHPAYDALFVQMALIYFWTAVAKTEPVWLSGETLDGIISAPEVRSTVLGWGELIGLEARGTMRALAWAVMLGEYAAPLLYLVRPLRPFGFLLIPWFHISVEWVGFDIELFSYYMIALNLCLLSPAWLWRPLERLRAPLTRLRGALSFEALGLGLTPALIMTGAVWVGMSAMLGVMMASLPVEGASRAAWLSAGLMALLALVELLLSARRAQAPSYLTPITLGLSLTMGLALLKASDFGFDYYRMWGGDLKRRGELERAVEVYQRANELKREGPARHAALGATLMTLGRPLEAVSAFEQDAMRWSALAQKQRAQGEVSGRAKQGLTRAYQGWSKALMSAGERESARAVLDQLNAALSSLR